MNRSPFLLFCAVVQTLAFALFAVFSRFFPCLTFCLVAHARTSWIAGSGCGLTFKYSCSKQRCVYLRAMRQHQRSQNSGWCQTLCLTCPCMRRELQHSLYWAAFRQQSHNQRVLGNRNHVTIVIVFCSLRCVSKFA